MTGSMKNALANKEKAAAIVSCAGGALVGRTRLQKTAYLMELAGYGEGFSFEYRHYGPYSEELSHAMEMAETFQLVEEEEKSTNWGGWYSIYRTQEKAQPSEKQKFVQTVSSFGAIELELAATAAFLSAVENVSDPWEETARRKPEKASPQRLEEAKRIYRQICTLPTRHQLPAIT